MLFYTTYTTKICPINWLSSKLYTNYIKAINKELLKIFSKMGISTLQSYQGAQIFECLGLNKDVIDKYFTGTISRIGGMGIGEIAREVLVRHKVAYPELQLLSPRLEVGGFYQWKQRGEAHIFNPQTVHLLQQSTRNNSYEQFKKTLSERGGFVRACWCGSAECEERVKTDTGSTIRTIPLSDEKPFSGCIYCSKPAAKVAYFAKSY